jgi:hypothetical protein
MQLVIFVVLLLAALVSSAIALFIGLTRISETAIHASMIAAGASAVFWMITVVGAFNVETISNGSVLTRSYPSLGAVGVAGIGLAVLVIYRGSVEVLG